MTAKVEQKKLALIVTEHGEKKKAAGHATGSGYERRQQKETRTTEEYRLIHLQHLSHASQKLN